MTPRNRIALFCLAVPALVEIGLGIVYCAATEPLPYHRQAMGADWERLEAAARTTVLTLVRGYGTAHVAAGVALVVLLVGPLRQGFAWARWALLAVGLPVLGGTAALSARLAALTGADVPWPGAVALLALFVLGVALADPATASGRAARTGPSDPSAR